MWVNVVVGYCRVGDSLVRDSRVVDGPSGGLSVGYRRVSYCRVGDSRVGDCRATTFLRA